MADVALAVEVLGARPPLQVVAGHLTGVPVAVLAGGQDADLLQELHLLLRGSDTVTKREQVVPPSHFIRLKP